MKKIVLTGGPCGGKSTVLKAINEEFRDQIILVPEVATILLEGGFPIPGKDLPWSEEWQTAFQSAVLPLQHAFEEAREMMAKSKGSSLIICDRGVLDGAAYTPGGVKEFCRRFGMDSASALARYDAIIHLESLATSDPNKYGKAGNENRFEPLERAQSLEMSTRSAWEIHSRQIIVNGRRGIDGKISEVVGIIRFLLADSKES